MSVREEQEFLDTSTASLSDAQVKRVLAAALPCEGAGRDELVEAMLRGFRWRNFETTESGLTARYEAAAMRNAYNALRAAILGDEGDSQ